MNAAEHYTTRYLEPKDLDQYNALLRYTFQVTEEELTATGWKDDEIKQSKFPVLERADVLGCFDGENLVSQFAVYPLKMNIYDAVYHVGFVTSVCTYPEYTGNGIMKRLMIQGLTQMHKEGKSFALQVDELVGQQQVVIKSLEQNFRRIDGIAGATIMGDGSVALILDVDALPRLAAQGEPTHERS